MDENVFQQGDETRASRREASPLIADFVFLLVLAYVLSFWLPLNGSVLREGVLL